MTLVAPMDVEYGEVFTRRWVVDAMLDLVGYTPDRNLSELRVVEPSIGSGAFFLPLVERLLTSARHHNVPLEQLSEALFGLDLQSVHVETCRAFTLELLRSAGAGKALSEELANGWLRQGDFLLDDVPTEVDVVIGNPPYIRTEDLNDDMEALYRARWTTMRGRSDIYIGFYERSLGLLNEGGRLAFICADRWMRNGYGKSLRNLVVSRYSMDSVWQMHDVDAFESEVSAYPAITALSRAPQGEVTVLDTTEMFSKGSVRSALRFIQSTSNQARGEGWEGARLQSWFETDSFWPAGKPHIIKLLERLQGEFPTLEADGSTRIGIGVATGADKAYIVRRDAEIDVEPSRLLPIVMADDIRSGQLESPAKLMLNPWDDQGNLIELTSYPRFAKVLGSNEAVKKRFVAKRNPGVWHRTIDKVQPGLAERPKLLFQDMKAKITPVYEPGGYYPHHNLYYIVSTSWDLEVLGGLLLSRIAEAFISSYGVKMRGGTLRFQAQYLRKIAVPRPESLNLQVANRLREAFVTGDREAATLAAEEAYGLPAGTV